MSNQIRHILSISGGKDSTALAVLLKEKKPDLPLEYVFCDTGEELPETYAYLEKIEALLDIRIVRLRAQLTWDQYLEQYSGYLPSARARWCTVQLKIKPFENYIGDSACYSYIGIRADEDREGYISSKSNILPVYPFKEYGITKSDVFHILNQSGLGLPQYYSWRTRSGCYFCFFQRRYEWLGLKRNHPGLFEKALKFETVNSDGSAQNFTWIEGKSLKEAVVDEEGIIKRHSLYAERVKANKKNKSLLLLDVFEQEMEFSDALDFESDNDGCSVCHI